MPDEPEALGQRFAKDAKRVGPRRRDIDAEFLNQIVSRPRSRELPNGALSQSIIDIALRVAGARSELHDGRRYLRRDRRQIE